MPLYRYTERYCQHHGPSQDSAADISGPQHLSPESGRLPTLPDKDLDLLTGPVWQRGPVHHDVRTRVRAGSHLYYSSVSTGILYLKPSICSTLGSIMIVGYTLCTWKCLHGRNVHKFWIELSLLENCIVTYINIYIHVVNSLEICHQSVRKNIIIIIFHNIL